VEGTKIVNWTKLILRMALAAMEGTRAATTLDLLLDAVKAENSEREYFRNRVQFFARQGARPTAADRRRAAYLAQRELDAAQGATEAAAYIRAENARQAALAEQRRREVVERNVFETAGEDLSERAHTPGTYRPA